MSAFFSEVKETTGTSERSIRKVFARRIAKYRDAAALLYGVGDLPSKVRALAMEVTADSMVQACLKVAGSLFEQYGGIHAVDVSSAARSELISVTNCDVQLALAAGNQRRLCATQAQPIRRLRIGAPPVAGSSAVQVVEESGITEEAGTFKTRNPDECS